MYGRMILMSLVLVSLSRVTHAYTLENPGQGRHYSGIGVISGWSCDVQGTLTIRFDERPPIPLAPTERGDTAGVCGDSDNGFVAIWNYAELGDGHHTAALYDDGAEVARSGFTVGTLGVTFHPAINGQGWTLPDFPQPGDTTALTWNPSTQHLEVLVRDRSETEAEEEERRRAEEEERRRAEAEERRRSLREEYRHWNEADPYDPYWEEDEQLEWWERQWEEWEREPSQRSSVDLPDDFSGPQIHLVYALPRGVADQYIDINGKIAAGVDLAQKWLWKEGGQRMRIDTYQGEPDITFVRMDFPEIDTYSDRVTSAAVPNPEPEKLYVIYYPGAGPGNNPCGLAWCDVDMAVFYIGDSACPGGLGSAPVPYPRVYWAEPTTLLHEVFHVLGAVDPHAPNVAEDGVHVATDHSGNVEGNDLMYAWGGGLDLTALDHDRDDYYGHGNPDLIDVADSPYLTREPW